MKKQNLEELLRQAIKSGNPVRLVPSINHENTVTFYIHIQNEDSQTLDFSVLGSILVPIIN